MGNIFNPDFLEYLQLLNQLEVEYVLVGGMAVNLHGYQRSTGDMDLFVNPTNENHNKLKKVHFEYGMPMGEMISVDNFLNTKVYDVFTFGGGFYKIEILTVCKGLNFEETLKNSMITKIEDVEITYANYNSLVKAKKASGRAKDLNDIEELEKIKKSKSDKS